MNPKTLAALASFTIAAATLAAALKALVPPQAPAHLVQATTHTLRVKAARAAQRGAWSLAGVSRRVHP